MNVFNEYSERKRALEETRAKMLNVLRQQDVNSVETFMVMKVLHDHENLTQRELANLSELSPGSVANIVISLAEKGYITNEKDENDYSKRTIRRKLLNLTDKGRNVYDSCIVELESE